MTEDSFPSDEMELTTILVVSDLEKSKYFYSDILGAELFREYGGTSIVYKFQSVWLLIVTGGDPTDDKPDIYFKSPQNNNIVSHAFTIRVKDCQKSYDVLIKRGAKFLTPPYDWGAEIRCFFQDPDGHLFEISQFKG